MELESIIENGLLALRGIVHWLRRSRRDQDGIRTLQIDGTPESGQVMVVVVVVPVPRPPVEVKPDDDSAT